MIVLGAILEYKCCSCYSMCNANGDDDEVGVLIYDDDNVRRCSITNLKEQDGGVSWAAGEPRCDNFNW